MKIQFCKTTHKLTVPLLTLIASGLLMAPAQAQTNLLKNGSFETGSFASWNSSVPAGNGVGQNIYGIPASDGVYEIVMNSGDQPAGLIISQSFPTIIGRTYTVRFDYSPTGGTQSLTVGFTGNTTQTVTATATSPFKYQTFSLTFTATQTTSTLTLADKPGNDTNSKDGFLDNIRVFLVNNVPVANSQSVATNEDTPATGTVKATDGDGDSLTYSKVAGPTNGSVVVNSDGTFTYTPNANFNGTDSFTFKSNDGAVDSNIGTVTINIAPVNDVPVVSDQSVTLPEDSSKTITISAFDPDGDPLFFNVVSGPSHGTLNKTSGSIIGGSTSVVYTPDANYNGPDSFSYTVSDRGGLYFSGNGHYYEYVAAPDISWDAAQAAASSKKLFGQTGYLATITSDAENRFVSGKLGGQGWLGGSDEAVENTWRWVTGPEGAEDGGQGRRFWNGKANGTPVAGQYANWNSGEPNGFAVEEDYLMTIGTGANVPWNDYPKSAINPGAPHFIQGYVIEYGGIPGEVVSIPTATVSINVTPVNDAPVASNSSLSVNEDTPGSGQLIATDVDGNKLSYGKVSEPAHGSVTVKSDGSFTYIPSANYNGPDSFSFIVTDAPGTFSFSNVATVSITVNSANDAPVVSGQSVKTAEDTAKEIKLAGSDVDGDTLTFSVVDGPSHGTLSGSGANLTYTPDANYNGNDSFTFKASDSTASSEVAQVNISVDAVNDAPIASNGSLITSEDTADQGTLKATDVDGDSLTYSKVSGATHGSVVVNADGSFTYTPNANYNGSDSFSFKANDGTADSNVATVNITVKSLNDAPVADEQSVETDEDSSKAITLSGTDVDGEDLTYAVIDGPSHGTISGSGANLTYTPNANYNGSDSFTFKTNDGTTDSNIAKVTITVKSVNDAPVALDSNAKTDEDTDINGTLKATDDDGDKLTYSLATDAAHGSVVVNADGSFLYTPNTDYNGSDSFSFKANDGTIESNTATVNIEISAVNDAPVAKGEAYSVDEDNTLTVPAPGVLGNDTDVDNISLIAVVVTEPSHGNLTLDKDGSFTYTPNADFNGSDSFTYKANDGNTSSEAATVNITVNAVNDTPVVTSSEVSTDEDTELSGTLKATDVDSDTLAYSKVAGPAHGSVTVNADGSFTYTPNANYNGSDSFTFKANDGTVDSNVATINIAVKSVNDAPVVSGQSVKTAEDTAKEIKLAGSDVDGDTLTFSVVDGPSHGTLSGSGANLTYTPDANYNGNDSFTFKASDSTASSNTATVNIEISAVNDAPVASNSTVATDEDTALNGTLKVNDVDGDALTYSKVGGPSHGSVVMNANGSFTYTPNANYNGSDSFTFKANDGTADSNVATVNITVKSVNDAPVAVNDSASTTSVTLIGGNVLTNDTDIDDDTLTAVGVTPPAHGIANLNADGSFTYTPAVGFTGTDSFTYVANDGTADSNVATVAIKVTQPATTRGDKVTGGGTLPNKTGGSASFNLNPQSDTKDSTIKGSLDYSDSQASIFVRSTSITGLVVNGNQARIFGKAAINGSGSYDFVVDVTDNGEPGSSDTYSIRLSNGYTNGPKKISSGNIQIHK